MTASLMLTSPAMSASEKPAFITIFRRRLTWLLSCSNVTPPVSWTTWRRSTTASSSAADKLRAYHGLYRDALADGTQLCLCVAFSAGRDSLTEPVLQMLNQFHADSVEWLTRILSVAAEDGSIASLTDTEAEAHATLALMEGAQLVARAANSAASFDAATAAFLARLSSPNTH